VEFAVPTDDTRVAEMISGYRVILVFLQIVLKASAGCAVLKHFGVFFSVTSYLPTTKEHVVFYTAVY